MMAPDSDYALIDFGEGRRLEQWGPVRVVRPDARALGSPVRPPADWDNVDARFEGRMGLGTWQRRRPVPDAWIIGHGGLQFEVRLAPSMHLGLFPEQATQWTWMRTTLAGAPPLDVLNLFAYTGGASIALAALGHRVTHVDASRPAIGWARKNAALNGTATIRWMHEDARRFVDREHRRGRRYDAVLMDPPAFGRGPAGTWRLDRDVGDLLEAAAGLLGPRPAFVLVNVYSGQQLDAGGLERLIACATSQRIDPARSLLEADTLTLSSLDGRHLATGIYARQATRCEGLATAARGPAS
jgi:23S rRNA (cytosine1962-C5)-methyltransferase